jgi:hypothetical protein
MAAAGSLVTTLNKMYNRKGRKLWEIICDYTVSTSGIVTINIGSTMYNAAQVKNTKLAGYLTSVTNIPGASGVPADNTASTLSITLTDSYGVDLMKDELLNLSTSLGYRLDASPAMFISDDVVLNVASIKSTHGGGRLIVYLEV